MRNVAESLLLCQREPFFEAVADRWPQDTDRAGELDTGHERRLNEAASCLSRDSKPVSEFAGVNDFTIIRRDLRKVDLGEQRLDESRLPVPTTTC